MDTDIVKTLKEIQQNQYQFNNIDKKAFAKIL